MSSYIALKFLSHSIAINWVKKKISVIFELMGFYAIVVSGIDPSSLASAEKVTIFQLEQRQGFLDIIQVVSNNKFGKIPKFKTPQEI
jgi:hypothetical protein